MEKLYLSYRLHFISFEMDREVTALNLGIRFFEQVLPFLFASNIL